MNEKTDINKPSNIDEKFLSPYDPLATEDNIYKKWQESGFFNPDICVEKGVTDKDAEPFSIILPPPNVTGILHMGHSAMLAIQDITVRYNRMKGNKTLWLPGTDHAAIATQSKVEKIIQKEKTNKHGMGREKFLERVDQFAADSHDTIVHQMKKMGTSTDWSREAFTLDETRHKAVYHAFKEMYDDGLIYQGNKIVNWDPKGQTVISDDEVDHVEGKGKFYYFKYSKDFPITIATTRPETKLGDTAVAVNPEDKRYKEFIGQTFEVDFMGTKLEIKIIGDEDVDAEFGTGAVGVTPAHSMIDFEMANRHDLPVKQVISEYAKMMTPDSPEIHEKKVTDARQIVVEWLEKEGLLEKTEEVDQNLSVAERTGGVIEPLPKLQWFVDVNKEFKLKESKMDGLKKGDTVTLKKLMQHVVKTNQIEIIPDRFNKIYFHWIDNLRDWCISRQIWYGHRIPVWYKDEEIFVGTKAPEGDGWTQDEDTLDTWFSSALWTFSTLGWPEKTQDMLDYHPTSLMETGYDIIFFWVARMILMSTYHLGEIPFKTVYLHGMVRDEKGQKMSKSLGNAIDPLEMSEKYGADAVRLSLIIGTGPGNDTKLSEDKIRAYKKFSNKIWNVSRFVLENINKESLDSDSEILPNDQKRLDELELILKDIDDDISNYRFYLAGEKLYHYVWHTFADIIIEESKEALNGENEQEKISKQKMLYNILTASLKALHPFIPFVTEEIWQSLPKKDSELLMVSEWPVK